MLPLIHRSSLIEGNLGDNVRIGVDVVPLRHLPSGIGYYTHYLLEEWIRLAPEDEFFLFADSPVDFPPYPNVRLVILPRIGYALWSQTLLSWACFRHHIDLFWGPAQSIPLLKRSSMKTILTQHDLVFRLYPETMTLGRRWYLKLFAGLMLRRANTVIAASHGTASKIKAYYNVDASVIHPPLKHLKHKQYLVTIGTLEPRKNLEALLDLYATVPNALPLFVIGKLGWKHKIKQLPQVHYLGAIPDPELASWLTGARYCILMSKYEGYGMPLAEARLCGTMPICTNLEEMREACENDGIFLSPDSWQKEIIPYLLPETPIRLPKPPTYPTNREKALRLMNSL
jgi:glycosyltransferase involved in cell wall biosynthesis